MKKKLIQSLRAILLFIFMIISLFTVNIYANDKLELPTDKNGNYLIQSEKDFNTFVNYVNSNEKFENKKVILCSDLDITATTCYTDDSTGFFHGIFDGKNHTINYKANDVKNYTNETSVFPFVFTNGKLKNINVNIDQCNISETCDFEEGLMPHDVGILSKGILKTEIEGLQLKANVKITSWGGDICGGFKVSTFQTTQNSTIKDCNISINYDLADESECASIIETIKDQTADWGYINDLALYQLGDEDNAFSNTYINCYSSGKHGTYLQTLVKNLKNWNISDDHTGVIARFIGTPDGNKSSAKSCFYDSIAAPELEAVCNSRVHTSFSNEETFAKTTEQMKNQATYEGFDFNKKWSISPDINDGYPYYDPRTEQITLKVKPIVADKVWNTTNSKDKNKYGKTDTYYYPYCGDDNGIVTGVDFTDLTKEQQEYVKTYKISICCDPSKDIESAKIDMNFLGNRPVNVIWKNSPTIVIANADQAEEDGYEFAIETVDGTAKVTENTNSGIPKDQWDTYYQKAKEAIQVIMKYCENTNGFGPKDSPSYENSDIWSVFTAARCGYIPYGDSSYFAKWFANTKIYLQQLKDNGIDFAKSTKITDIAKLALAIEAIGYDLRDISSVDLLEAVGTLKDSDEDLFYKYEYMIHAIKAGGYSSTSSSFTDDDMKNWAIKRADSLLNADDSSFVNPDNSMGWQPLIYWYDNPDVKTAVDAAEKRYPIIGQRATGAFCTNGYETQCPTYGNNAWNNAQALLFAGEFNINVLDYTSGYTKNGNNILNAVFDQINFSDTSYSNSTIPGFYSYDPAQIARGLCSFVRSYERNIKNENIPAFWVFTDVDVPTKTVNDLILALNDKSTKEEIEAARKAYDALDETHKAIFNKDTLRKLLEAENGKGDSITKVIAAIDALPAADKLTLEDKDAVVKARTLYDSLNDEEKSVITNYSKLTEAEAKIRELEKQQEQKDKDKKVAEKVIADIDALPSSSELTLDPYVLQLLDRVQAEYNALTDAQKALVTNYSTLQYLRNLIPDLKAAAAVVDKIKAIGEVTSDNYLKKQALVVEARTAYDALTADQKKRVTNYAELEKAELFISRQSTDEKVAYVISFIDELNITTSSSGALSDGPLRLTEKNNNVPTEKIWNDWKAYVVNARALYDTLDDQQKAQVTNTASLEKAEGYIYQLKADALKAMLKALPDAQTVRGYEAPQPTTVPSAQEAASVEEEQAVPAQSEGSDFSDGSADAFSSDEVDEQAAETVDIPQAESAEDTEDVQTDVDFSSDEEVPAAGDTSKRELTEAELKQIAEAKNAYDRLTETEEKKFRSENTALVENMEKLLAMALTYEKGQSAYQQFFADEAAQIYATVKDHPVDRDSYADVKAFLDRYAKDYQGQEDAMAGLKVKVGSQEMTFAEVIAALTAQADKAGKDISDAQQADEWISNLPTAVTKENIANVEAELAALQKLIDGMSVEGKSYMWNAKQLGLIKTIVADYHIELAGKQGAFKADMPADLQTKAINYKTVQISWSSVDNADGYMVYRRTADSGWKKIASRVTDISYKDQKAVTGTTYYYTVKAYSYAWGEMTVSSYDKDGVAGKARLGKVKIATANSESYSTIRVTWNKVSGANGYRVYRSTSKDGKYTAIGSTAKNSAVTFLDKKAVTGKTYYYKVRAYRNVSGKKVYGSYSATEKAKAVLSAPTLSAGSTSKTAVLEWSKVKGADGYQVYASDSQNGTYTRIKITKGTGATDESLLTGKTRYYKVRAYRKVNGKAVYGSFSKIKKVTVK
jgi:fibronectin type 3 domain-containing protein